MNQKLNESLTRATEDIFENALGWSVKSSPPKERPINESWAETSVIISFVGSISGALTLKCSKKLASHIATDMLGTKIEEGSDDMKDAVGELLNMIIGSTKLYFSSNGDPFKISVPTIIIGQEYSIHVNASQDENITQIDFDCDGDGMSIDIYLT